MSEQLIIEIWDGPLVLRSGGAGGIDRDHALWDGISAHEYFPPGVESAKYRLSLSSSVGSLSEFSATEDRMIKALNLLSLGWAFSGGGFLNLKTAQILTDQRYSSNRDAVREALLRKEGVQAVGRAFPVSAEALGSYGAAPLGIAVEIAVELRRDDLLRRTLTYYDAAERSRRSRFSDRGWILDLPKVRESLTYIHGSQAAAKRRLGISAADWRWFGRFLNKEPWDNRHAPRDLPTTPRADDISRAFQLIRSWLQKELSLRGVSTVWPNPEAA